MKTIFAFVVLTIWLSLLSLTGFGAETSVPEMKVRLALVVAWEGAPVESADVQALKALRSATDGARWIHLFDASLWSREPADIPVVRDMIKVLVEKSDITGLHIAPWKSVVDKAGVTFRRKPTFWGNVLAAEECARDCGREVPLATYSALDVAKIIRQANTTVKDGGVANVQAFMVGGHGADRKILEAACAAGLMHDFSGVVPGQVEKAFVGYPLWSWVSNVWSGVRADRNVVAVETEAGPVWRYVVNAGQADWHSGDDMVQFAKDLVADARRDKRTDVDLVFLIHGDTAVRTAPRVAQAFRVLASWWPEAKVTTMPMDLRKFE